MTRFLYTILVFSLATLGTASSAFAQRGTFLGRGFIVVNGGYQVTGHNFERASVIRANTEDGNFTTDYEVKSGPSFDVAGGATLFRNLAVSAGVTRFSRSTPSALTGSVPHPFFFNRPREVTSGVMGLDRQELAVHVQARALAPIGSRLQVMAFGGPSFFHVKQGVVTTFTWTESYPFDTAAFDRASIVSAKGSRIGFNVGADLAFFFSRQVGIGGTVQFSGATVDLNGEGSTQEVKAGGTTVGAGLRLRF